MKAFKPIFDDCDEKFGMFEEPKDEDVVKTRLVVHLVNGETIEANSVGIDAEEGVCRHFTWEVLDEETVRESIEDQPLTYQDVLDDEDIEIGESFMLMNGIIPWDNVAHIELDTQGLF